MQPTVVPMAGAHGPAVLAIYQAGLDTGDASFETTAPSWQAWDRGHLAAHRFVALDAAGGVLGWVAASAVSPRPVYAGVIEHSLYVAPASRGTGVGRALLARLITSAQASGVWTIESGVFPENAASLALHAGLGFRIVGRRERIARHHGVWRDTLLLEYRTAVV